MINCITCKKEVIEDNYYCYCKHPKVEKQKRHRFSLHNCPVHEFKNDCKDRKDWECMKYSSSFVNKKKIEAHKICYSCGFNT